MKELRMENGDVIDADDVPAGILAIMDVTDEQLEEIKRQVREASGDPNMLEWVDAEDHRLAHAEPAEVPADAPRDENDDPIFDA